MQAEWLREILPRNRERSKPHDRIRVKPVSSSPSLERTPAIRECGHAVDLRTFRNACALFATGVAVASVMAADGTPHGLTISSFTSVSIDPPLILISIDLSCAFISHFRQGTHFAVNILSEAQRDVSITFVEKPEGRFEGTEWVAGRSGARVLAGCLAAVECRTASIVEAGDHAIFIGEVENAESRAGRPLLYFERDYRSLA